MIRATARLVMHHRRHRPLVTSAAPASAAPSPSSTRVGDDDRLRTLGLAAAAAALAGGAATVPLTRERDGGGGECGGRRDEDPRRCRCERDVDVDVDVPAFALRTVPADSDEILSRGREGEARDGGRSRRAHARAVLSGLSPGGGSGAWPPRDGGGGGAPVGGRPLATSDAAPGVAAGGEVGVVADGAAGPPPGEAVLRRIDTVRRKGLGRDQVYTKKMYFYQCTKIREDMRPRFRLFALPSSEDLGREMAYLLGTSLNLISVGSYADGETSVKIDEGVRGNEVYVVCSTTTTNSILELLLTVSALRRGSAKRICAVIPYYGYSRQDRRTGLKREPIAAADVARLLEEMGVDSVICCDLHNPLVKGFFRPMIPVDHLMPGPVAAAYFYEELFDGGGGEEDGDPTGGGRETPKITVVAAHENQVFRANAFRSALQKLSRHDDIRVALVSNTKDLKHDNESDSTTLVVGDVRGRKCIM
jgi:ribose-phosphate pyrophosphokinase